MKNTLLPLAKIIDTISITLLIFLISYFLSFKIAATTTLRIFLTVSLSIVLIFIYSIISNKSKQKYASNSQKNKEIEAMINSLKVMTPKETFLYLKDSLASCKKTLKSSTNKIILELNKTTLLDYNFYKQELDIIDITKNIDYATTKNMNLIFLGISYSPNAIAFSKNNPTITLLDASQTHALITQLNNLSVLLHKQHPSKPIKPTKNIFLKKNAPNFIKIGLLFIFLSFILPLKNYYKIFGITFLIFALVLILKKETHLKQQPLPKELLE